MLNDSLTVLKGIGAKRSSVLTEETSIETIEDLLYYSPRRYIDHSSFKKVSDCHVNDEVTVRGKVEHIEIHYKKKKYLEVIISDETGSISAVFFGGVQFLQKKFSINDEVLFSGKITFYRVKQMTHPSIDFLNTSETINTGRIIPLYPSSEKLKDNYFDSRGFRTIIHEALNKYKDSLTDPLNDDILSKYDLIPLQKALFNLHFPESFEDAEKARTRLAFNELFFLQFYLILSKKLLYNSYKLSENIPKIDIGPWTKQLPFKLTSDQSEALEVIVQDIATQFPMSRLLQGDVGSGKTVVAAGAAVAALSMGVQVAIMAPTEILAQQLYKNIKLLLGNNHTISLLTGKISKKNRDQILTNLSQGDTSIAVGTHALIQKDVIFKNLGMVIIDEQHRFGAEQRSNLRLKGHKTDMLVMTATPIPRSLSLTVFGDLDLTEIREKPSNRGLISTLSFPESRIKGVYNSIKKYIDLGQQVYYVLPLIEESSALDLKSAKMAYEEMSQIFSDYNVVMLHGKLKNEEKKSIMAAFSSGEVNILVTTTVIEVGIDVPNATVMVIHDAWRFGLSQLHQLRGRIGRGPASSFCILLYPDDIDEDSLKRINIIKSTTDGFKIAEEDLSLRGAGQIIGTRQHGFKGDFEFVDLVNDMDLISAAKKEAARAVEQIELTEKDSIDRKMLTGIHTLEGIRSKKILSILS